MTLAEAIREAIAEFWKSVEQTDIVYAVYSDEGLKVDESGMYIPIERVDVPQVYSQQGTEIDIEPESGPAVKGVLRCTLKDGDRVVAAVHHGGQRCSVLYKL